jgi:hypothetical protein
VRSRANRRRSLRFLVGLALLVVVALLVSAAVSGPVRTFALDVPNAIPVAQLHPSLRSCEGPVVSDGPAGSVGIWGAAASGRATLTVQVQDARTNRILATGPISATTGNGRYTAHLSRAVAGGRPLRICVLDDSGQFVLSGSTSAHPNIIMTGGVPGAEFSLVLLRGRSLLDSLPLAFGRASLWRPSWVGGWTFWVLTIALLATFGLGVGAVLSAAAADDEDGDPPHFDDPPSDGVPPAPENSSESGQDRPQPVA